MAQPFDGAPGHRRTVKNPVDVDACSDAFHMHLDDCRRCRENPFDLCDSGRVLSEMFMQAVGRLPADDGALRGPSQR